MYTYVTMMVLLMMWLGYVFIHPVLLHSAVEGTLKKEWAKETLKSLEEVDEILSLALIGGNSKQYLFAVTWEIHP